MTGSDYKKCVRCGAWWPRTTDYFSPCRSWLQSYCKPNGCEKAYHHERYVRKRDADYEVGRREKKVPLTPERRREQALAYYYRHHAAIREKERTRYTDPDRRAEVLANQAELRRKYPERRAAIQKKWNDANRIRRAGYAAKRRALKAQSRVEPKISYVGILREHGRHCHICGKPILLTEKLTFDHIVPLAVGGAHTRANLAPAHASCNFRKGAKLPDYVAA